MTAAQFLNMEVDLLVLALPLVAGTPSDGEDMRELAA